MCERRACVVVFEGGQEYYRMHVYAQHDARSRIASERCRLTRRCPAYRVEMSAAMPMDLGEKEEKDAVMQKLRGSKIWDGLGDEPRRIFLVWDKGDELTIDEQVKLRAKLMSIEEVEKRTLKLAELKEKVEKLEKDRFAISGSVADAKVEAEKRGSG